MPLNTAEETFETVVTVTPNAAVDRLIDVPDFQPGAHLVGEMVLRQPAGKGLNVSRALALLGVPSVAIGFVGEAELPAFEAACPAGLSPQFLAVSGLTRENITLLDPVNHRETHIRTSGFSVSPRDLERMEKKLRLLVKPKTLVIFSGSLPPGMEGFVLADWVDLAIAAGARVAVDVSAPVLPCVIDRALWLIKPNREELAGVADDLDETEASLIAVGQRLKGHIHTVLVTTGAGGGFAFSSDDSLRGYVDTDGVEVVNSVGCGDALLAGFVAARHRGDAVADAFSYALAVATAAATSAAPGTFALDGVQRFQAKTTVSPI